MPREMLHKPMDEVNDILISNANEYDEHFFNS